jgi:hypothetical protein
MGVVGVCHLAVTALRIARIARLTSGAAMVSPLSRNRTVKKQGIRAETRAAVEDAVFEQYQSVLQLAFEKDGFRGGFIPVSRYCMRTMGLLRRPNRATRA